jgi:hypothetical protein
MWGIRLMELVLLSNWIEKNWGEYKNGSLLSSHWVVDGVMFSPPNPMSLAILIFTNCLYSPLKSTKLMMMGMLVVLFNLLKT